MKNLCIITLIIFTVYSCTKENHKIDINIKKEDHTPTEYFSFPTNIKKWKNYVEVVVDDSLKKVHGEFENYYIEGYIDRYGHKKGWWNIVNRKNLQADNIKLEYCNIDKRELVNQYIYYSSNGGSDTVNSLFYLKETLNDPNLLRYKFYTPNKKVKLNISGKLFISFFSNSKELKSEDLKCLKNDKYYYVDVDVSKYKGAIVKGLFEEVYEYEDGETGINDIYISDTLK